MYVLFAHKALLALDTRACRVSLVDYEALKIHWLHVAAANVLGMNMQACCASHMILQAELWHLWA